MNVTLIANKISLMNAKYSKTWMSDIIGSYISLSSPCTVIGIKLLATEVDLVAGVVY